ncbi:MAG TPA: hypothetical protein VL326_29045 [Kofleriaceae bacterium]|nr:hypothetical protein [Kofleriaceae bacterium]
MCRVALAAAIAVGLAACGDNEPECGTVEVLIGEHNVWSPMFAIDERFMYYADYDIDGFGTALVIRASRDGGGLVALGQLDYGEMFGNGLAYDETNLFWTGSGQEQTYFALNETPRAGGPPYTLAYLPGCVPFGMTTSATEVFAGMASCDPLPSRVTAVDKATGMKRIAWEAGMFDGDVRALAYADDTLFIGTTIALFAIRPSGTNVITAGSPIRHLEIHGGYLYYSEEHYGVFRTPTTGGPREQLYEYAPTNDRQGAFSVDGDDLYVAEPPHMLRVRNGSAQIIVNDLGSVSEIAASDGYAWWSALVYPNAPGGFDTFSGAIARVARPCD